jgi:hypothetical protein
MAIHEVYIISVNHNTFFELFQVLTTIESEQYEIQRKIYPFTVYLSFGLLVFPFPGCAIESLIDVSA